MQKVPMVSKEEPKALSPSYLPLATATTTPTATATTPTTADMKNVATSPPTAVPAWLAPPTQLHHDAITQSGAIVNGSVDSQDQNQNQNECKNDNKQQLEGMEFCLFVFLSMIAFTTTTTITHTQIPFARYCSTVTYILLSTIII